jgi:predicted DNA-binding transcriptional regulator YafY
MRRADRLFQIIQILRRTNRPITAGRLAEELEVSTRSVYRDVADLIGTAGADPRRGGVGLRPGARLRHAAADAHA